MTSAAQATSVRAMRCYVAATIGVGMLLVAVSAALLPHGDWGTVVLLVLLHVVAAKLSEHRHHAQTRTHLALGSVVVLGALFLLGPAAAVLVAAADLVAEDRSRPLHKRAFNAAVLSTAVALAGAVMIAVGGTSRGLKWQSSVEVIPVIAADFLVWLVPVLMVGAVIALSSGERLLPSLRSIMEPSAVLELSNGFLGVGLAVIWGPAGLGPFSLLLVAAPLYGAVFAYAQVNNLQEAYERTVSALMRSVETKDVYTRGHGERVSRASVLLGREMHLAEARITALSFAAMLHDVGKIAVPTRVLQKAGRLTDEEFKTIQLHPERGQAMIAGIAFLSEAQAGILHHHERLDGLGYPLGLSGDEIPEFARLIAVADAFDSMTSTRSYRGARSIDSAMAELRRCAGTQFDRVAVEALAQALTHVTWLPTTGPAAPLITVDPHSGTYDDTMRAG